MKTRRACSIAVAGLALAAFGPVRPGQTLTIESCVGAGRLELGRQGGSAVLDEDDRTALSLEIARRYPVVARDGWPISRLLFGRAADGQLLYVTALTDPGEPSRWCYTATFAAERFDLTPGLRARYLGEAR